MLLFLFNLILRRHFNRMLQGCVIQNKINFQKAEVTDRQTNRRTNVYVFMAVGVGYGCLYRTLRETLSKVKV